MSDDCPHGVDQIECWLCAENADAEAWRADRAELVALRAERDAAIKRAEAAEARVAGGAQ